MNLNYYIIRGRGENGQQFQLAKLEDSAGNNFKGEYDMARHFNSIEELKTYVASTVVNIEESELELTPMNI